METPAQFELLMEHAQQAYERYVETMCQAGADYANMFPLFAKLPGEMQWSWIQVVKPFFHLHDN